MSVPSDLKYTKEHEWVKLEGKVATVGITDYAQGELGDIVFVELPAVGDSVEKLASFGTIEAVKAVSEMYSPVTGKVSEVNGALEDDPTIINSDPYGEGWMVKIEVADADDTGHLLDAAAYTDLLND
jgi:glycine cleavage system H protein